MMKIFLLSSPVFGVVFDEIDGAINQDSKSCSPRGDHGIKCLPSSSSDFNSGGAISSSLIDQDNIVNCGEVSRLVNFSIFHLK